MVPTELKRVNELQFDDPCILFAMHREAQAFYRQFPRTERFPDARFRASFCGPSWLSVLVLETGIGAEAMKRAVSWVLSKPRKDDVTYLPKVVLTVGYAGGLSESLQVGDVVLATSISTTDGRNWPTTWPGDLPPGDWHPPLHRGRILCSDHLVAKHEEKRKLGEQHGALAVDMESAIVADLCAQKQIPFGCVRVISDDVRTNLSPALVGLLSDSRLNAWRILKATLRSPSLLPEFMRLAKHTRHASEQLALALGELLTLTLPFGAELGA